MRKRAFIFCLDFLISSKSHKAHRRHKAAEFSSRKSVEEPLECNKTKARKNLSRAAKAISSAIKQVLCSSETVGQLLCFCDCFRVALFAERRKFAAAIIRYCFAQLFRRERQGMRHKAGERNNREILANTYLVHKFRKHYFEFANLY